MDPQQRISLECAYEALEDAGISLDSVAGQNVGVFAGGSYSDYGVQLLRDPETAPMFQATGCADAMMANRISYLFDLKGPSFTVDTACSSSLTAIHLACQSLKTGESKISIAGGCHLNISPDHYITFSMSRLLSPEGKSYPFDHRATSGYGTGEGAGYVILKPLDDAIKAGDNVRAVISGSGVNQDGKSPGITTPTIAAQEALIRKTYGSNALDFAHTGYIETHGTGTAVGDPIEATALRNIFSQYRTPGSPLYLGSLKSNVGHLEGASGVVSLIKTAMMIERGFILPNCDFDKSNPKIPISEWNMEITKTQLRWPPMQKRQASINNFGYGGANAHIVIEAAPPVPEIDLAKFKPSDFIPLGKSRRLIVLSANDLESLKAQAENLLVYLRQRPEFFYSQYLASLALTLQRRSLLPWKYTMSASSMTEIMRRLQNDQMPSRRSITEPGVGFIFTGQGAQWVGMGRELQKIYPIFASSLGQAERTLHDLGAEWSLIDELMKDAEASHIGRAYISQPACTAIQLALVDLLSSWNIVPCAVAGHSSGEIAAAYAAGALSFDTCMKIAYHRGTSSLKLNQHYPRIEGAMMAVGCSPADAETLLIGEENAQIACINSPLNVTISGSTEAVTLVGARANAKNMFNRRLKTDVAYHSHHMRLIAEDYRSSLDKIEPLPHPPRRILFHSSLRGRLIDTDDLDTSYWVANLVSPVLFSQALQNLCAAKIDGFVAINTLVEIGPHAALKGPIRQIAMANPEWGKNVEYLPSLLRKEDSVKTTMDLAAELLARGAKIDLFAVNIPLKDPRPPTILTDLRPYSWNHTETFWHESRLSQGYRLRSFPPNDVLGVAAADFNDIEPRWRNVIRLSEIPWLRQHVIQSKVTYPMAGYISMAIEAAHQQATSKRLTVSRYKFKDVYLTQALVLEETSTVETMLSLRPFNDTARSSSDKWTEFRVFSWREAQGWTEHCRGLVAISKTENLQSENELEMDCCNGDKHGALTSNTETSSITKVAHQEMYKTLAKTGVDYGELFRCLSDIRKSEKTAIGKISHPDVTSTMPENFQNELVIHPVYLDSCFHIIWPLINNDQDPYVISSISSLSFSDAPYEKKSRFSRLYASLSTGSYTSKEVKASISAFDDDTTPGKHMFDINGVVFSRISRGRDQQAKSLSYKTEWRPDPRDLKFHQFSMLCTLDPLTQDEKQNINSLRRASLGVIFKTLQNIPEERARSLPTFQRNLYLWMQKQAKLAKQSVALHQNGVIHRADRESETLLKVGECLSNLLGGQEAQTSNTLEQMTKFNLANRCENRSHKQAAAYIDLLANQNPHMKVLEIGFNPNGATASFLKALSGSNSTQPPRFGQYTLTDTSELMLEHAKGCLSKWSDLVEYRSYDLGQSPLEQGFDISLYDVVLVCSGLPSSYKHDALRNIWELLRPGGKLVLFENAVDSPSHLLFRFFSFVIQGATGDEEETIPLSDTQWNAALQESGFSGLDGCLQDHPDLYHTANLIFSTAIKSEAEYQGDVLIVSSQSPDRVSMPALEEKIREMTGHGPEIVTLKEASKYDLNAKICLYLDEIDKSILTRLDPEQYNAIRKLCLGAKGTMWVTQGASVESTNPEANMILGLARSIRSENNVKIVVLDLDQQHPLTDLETADILVKALKRSFYSTESQTETEMEFSERQGILHIPRMVIDNDLDEFITTQTQELRPKLQPFAQDRSLKMMIRNPGFLDSFYFAEQYLNTTRMEEYEVEIKVEAMGVNFKDVMVALGQIEQNYIGLECSGTITSTGSAVSEYQVGDRVCAVPRGSYSTHVRCNVSSAARVPDEMSFVEAASIPIIFCTAYYSLIDVAQLRKGESVLIHSAAGGVGQAAIMLSQMIGAKIFATVGSVEKRDLLIRDYGITQERIFYSRSTSFADKIRQATGEKGVDVVLNSLSGEALRTGWEECLAHFGRFVEIGKRDILLNRRLEMAQFAHNVTFASVDFSLIVEERPDLAQRLLNEVIALHRDKVIRPIAPITTFAVQDIEFGFRALQSGKSTGKLVVVPNPGDKVLATPPTSQISMLNADATYLIAGGAGGLGRSMARYFIQQGAKYIILASRRGSVDKQTRSMIEELGTAGAKVIVHQCDVSKQDQVEKMISDNTGILPPIRGVIHGAMVLHDQLFEQLSYEDYCSMLAPKIQGAWALHNALPKTLDFFVMLSAVAGTYGSRGQAAYAGTSTFLGAFAQWRKAQGLAATTIHLGAVSDVGFFADNADRHDLFAATYKDRVLSEREFLAFVKAAIQAPSAREEITTSLNLSPDTPLPYWATDAKFSHCRRATIRAHDLKKCAASSASTGQMLRQARSVADSIRIVYEGLAQKFCLVLMIPLDDITPAKPVVAYGLDSLVAIEIRNWISTELQVKMQLLELLTANSLMAVAEYVVGRSKLVHPSLRKGKER